MPFKLSHYLLTIVVTLGITLHSNSQTYDFESDTPGSPPNNVTSNNGTFEVNADTNRTQTMTVLSSSEANTASFTLDLFPTSTNYSVTWKETYETAGRSGVILRGHGENSQNPGSLKGYLFQASPLQNHTRIYKSNADGYTNLIEISLAATGANVSRWYRATINGSTLTFEYSDDGLTFTLLTSITDSTYMSAGATQYTRGYGNLFTGSYVDDISFYEIEDELTITNIDEYQIFQRSSSNTADILISGSYTGTPTAIEASFNGENYVTIDANPSNGEFTGTLANQNVGQGTLDVRFTNDTSKTSSVNNVGIGDIYVIAGQSNASGRGNNLNSYTHASLKATLFGNDDVWKNLEDATDSNSNQIDGVSTDSSAKGSPWPIVATNILANSSVPVAFVPTAKGGTSIDDWQPATNHSDTSTLYGSMHRRINAVGGKVAGVLFFQGESDASTGTIQSDYETGLTTIVNTIATDFPDTKTMIGQIGHNNYSGNDAIRAGQIAVINTNDNALMGPATYDIDLSDGDTLHFKSDGDMAIFASRWYTAINKGFYNATDGYGPILDKENLHYEASTNKITVPFTDASLPTIDSNSTVTTSSFNLTNNGSPISISEITITDSTIEITPSVVLDSASSITLSYASLNTAVSAAIYDTNSLPAQPFYNEVVNVVTEYVYDDAWSPSDPNGVANTFDNIIVEYGNATITTTTNCANIIVNPTASLTIENGVTLNIEDSLLLESNSTNYSCLILDGDLTGTIYYSRHINSAASSGATTGDNDLVSPPLGGQNFGDFSTANSNILTGNINGVFSYLFGGFDTANNAYIHYNASNYEDPLVAGMGYRTGSTDNGNYIFTGTPATGSVTIPVSSAGLSHWNLIGNPYPSYIKVRDFLDVNSALFDENSTAIYGYDGYEADGWTIHNFATTSSSTAITPGQGFYINVVTSGDIQFTQGMRTIGTTDDFIQGRNSEDTLTYLKLGLSSGSQNYQTALYINPNASLGLDPGYDANVWKNTAPNFSIYSNLVEDNLGNPMAIQAIDDTNLSNLSIPIGVNANAAQTITFSLTESVLPDTHAVYLDDTLENTSTLLTAGDYTIVTNTALNGIGRFYLRFSTNTLSTVSTTLNAVNIVTHNYEKQIEITGQLPEHSILNIYDLHGRLIRTQSLQSDKTSQYIDVSQLVSGIYAVQISNSSLTKVQKVILR
ncbi:MAG: sialate O-acetylesterase [Winogradskyella arenosi]